MGAWLGTRPSVEEPLDRIARLEAELARRDRELAAKDRRIAELERIIEAVGRRGKRQAAPFSKGVPSLDPKQSGRKPVRDTGTKRCRSVPGGWTRRSEWDAHRSSTRSARPALPICCDAAGR